MTDQLLQGVHHVAYRCRDARETVRFYRDALGMDFQLAIAEDHVPSTGDYDPYMHVFLDAGNGNVLAFFELPKQPPMDRDQSTPEWVQHIAFRVGSLEALLETKHHLESMGLAVVGPTHHGIFKSIYFFDPNGHRVELAADIGTPAQMAKLRAVADEMLAEWSETKKAPRHAAWLHELVESEGGDT
ncbi:MAG: VOC family protein [Pseudomonadota bacterium]